MEKHRYIRRAVDPTDRRAIQVVLTDEGRSALRVAWQVHIRGVNEHWVRHVEPAQARVIAAAFGDVRTHLESNGISKATRSTQDSAI